MASGTMKSTAASSHSVTDPGPACAAAGIQRVPTMHVMAKNVMSRSPSSRFSCGAFHSASSIQAPHLGVEFAADAPQSFAQKLRFSTQPDADVAFQAEVRAGNNQHALLHADALRELQARGWRLIAHQAQRARLRFAKGQKTAETGGPLAHDRQVVPQNRTRARVELLAV